MQLVCCCLLHQIIVNCTCIIVSHWKVVISTYLTYSTLLAVVSLPLSFPSLSPFLSLSVSHSLPSSPPTVAMIAIPPTVPTAAPLSGLRWGGRLCHCHWGVAISPAFLTQLTGWLMITFDDDDDYEYVFMIISVDYIPTFPVRTTRLCKANSCMVHAHASSSKGLTPVIREADVWSLK